MAMDPYAAQTYAPPPPSSAQIQQDPYIYNQQYDQSQQYPYYPQIPQHQYPNPNPNVVYQQQQQLEQDPNANVVYQPQTEQEPSPNPNPNPNAVYQQPPEQESAAIHPPGVPVQNDPNQISAYQHAYYQTDPNSYYPQHQPQQQLGYPDPAMVHPGQEQWQQQPPQGQQQWQPPQGQQQWQPPQGLQPWQQPGQPGDYGLTSIYPPNGGQGGHYGGGSGRGGGGGGGSGGGRGRGRGFRGGGGGGSSSLRGRGGRGGRGGGRGGGSSSFRGGQPKPPPKPQFLAWCELCRVDCNTHEVLENHKNGKKHKKNLEIQQDLARLAAKSHEAQIQHDMQKFAPSQKPEIPNLVNENPTLVSQNPTPVSQNPTPVNQNPTSVNESRGESLKRKMRDEEGKSAEPEKKQKEIVPFICELCNVKCESAPSFDSHLKGRKHAFNLQQFQEQQATLGQVALQALYPALEVLYPALIQALSYQTIANASTSYGNGGFDQQVLQLLQPYLPQTGLPQVFPHRPQSAGPALALEPAREAPKEVVENKAVPANEGEKKNEDQVEPPESKTEQVDSKSVEPPESMTEQVDSKAVEPEQPEPTQ